MISQASTSSSCNQRPIMLIDNVQLKEEEEDECYELMEEEDEDDEYVAQSRETADYECLEEVNCSTEGSSRKPSCSICGRSYSSKYLLFRWPVDHRMRITWAAEIGLREAPTEENAFICAIHFSSSDFSFINGRIFWEKGSFPRYKNTRPSNEPPFPWERQRTEYPKPPNRTEAKLVVDHSNYQVSYRRSFYKNKRRNAHEVAVISKLDTNTYLEFSYNRTSQLDGTKFYSCLGCRKAKAESDVKDVIRTIHIDGTVILSKDDPFYGHHYACFPIQSEPPLKSYRPAIPQPMHMDMGVVYASSGDVIYVDEEVNPTDSVWDSVDNSSLINIDEIPFYGEISHQKVAELPATSSRSQNTSRRRICNNWKTRKPKCHLCFMVLPSTIHLIKHLENHLHNQERCRKCNSKISVDHHPSKTYPLCRTCKKKE